MKNRIIFIIALVAVLALSSYAFAQRGQGQNGPNAQAASGQASIPFPPGWKPCPRCQNNEDRRQDTIKYKVPGHAFDPHDLTGVCGYDGIGRAFSKPPEFTPLPRGVNSGGLENARPMPSYPHTPVRSCGSNA